VGYERHVKKEGGDFPNKGCWKGGKFWLTGGGREGKGMPSNRRVKREAGANCSYQNKGCAVVLGKESILQTKLKTHDDRCLWGARIIAGTLGKDAGSAEMNSGGATSERQGFQHLIAKTSLRDERVLDKDPHITGTRSTYQFFKKREDGGPSKTKTFGGGGGGGWYGRGNKQGSQSVVYSQVWEGDAGRQGRVMKPQNNGKAGHATP